VNLSFGFNIKFNDKHMTRHKRRALLKHWFQKTTRHHRHLTMSPQHRLYLPPPLAQTYRKNRKIHL
jgi:hypothetical protein